MKLKRATMYINKIAKSIKVEEVVILSASKKSTPTVYYAKVFFTWLIQDRLDVSFRDIGWFINFPSQEFVGKHAEILSSTNYSNRNKYGDIHKKLLSLIDNVSLKNIPILKSELFDTPADLAIYVNPDIKNYTKKLRVFPPQSSEIHKFAVANFILNRICERISVSREKLTSKLRFEELVYGRYVFMKIMKEFFPLMTLYELGTFCGITDHATARRGIEFFTSYFEKAKYRRIYMSVYESCMVSFQESGLYIFPPTIEGLTNSLKEHGCNPEFIENVKTKLVESFIANHKFSKLELSNIVNDLGLGAKK